MVYTCFNFKLELRFSVLHSLKRMQNQSESQNIRQSMYINYSCHILKILDNVSKHRKASCGILEELLCNVSTWPIVNRHRAAHMFSGILDKITQDAQLPKANQALVHLTFFNKHCGILEELLWNVSTVLSSTWPDINRHPRSRMTRGALRTWSLEFLTRSHTIAQLTLQVRPIRNLCARDFSTRNSGN